MTEPKKHAGQNAAAQPSEDKSPGNAQKTSDYKDEWTGGDSAMVVGGGVAAIFGGVYLIENPLRPPELSAPALDAVMEFLVSLAGPAVLLAGLVAIPVGLIVELIRRYPQRDWRSYGRRAYFGALVLGTLLALGSEGWGWAIVLSTLSG